MTTPPARQQHFNGLFYFSTLTTDGFCGHKTILARTSAPMNAESVIL